MTRQPVDLRYRAPRRALVALLVALCALLVAPAVSQADTIFGTTAPASGTAVSDGQPIEVGVKFRTSQNGFITGVRFYKQSNNTGTHIGHLWSSSGQQLAEATFTGETASGWQQVQFSSPVAVTSGTTYIASYYSPTGFFAFTSNYFGTARTSGAITALANNTDGGNGVFGYGASGFPTLTYNASNYWVDAIFATTATDTTAPTVSSISPANGATGVAQTTAVTATFNEAMNASTINATNVRLTGPGGTAVAASVTYSATTRTATLTPSAALAASTTYTATVKGGAGGVADTANNVLATDRTWTFTTGAPGQDTCPCTVFGTTAPSSSTAVSDGQPIEVGMKLRASESGFITALRFYKQSNNTGTHVGRLWSTSGQQLATVTYTGESASGWQQAELSSPVAVTAGTTYIVSYFSPTGFFAYTTAYFGNAVTNGPLTALANGTDGGNGVYGYGAGGTFPTSTYNSSNYWVDAVFRRTVAPDTTAPKVTTITPADTATSVPVGTTVTAAFDEPMNAATINATNVRLTGPGGAAVAASVTYSAATRTATLTPSAALAASTTYTATVKGGAGGAADTSNNVLAADRTWTFTTATPQQDGCPCTVFGTTAPSSSTAVSDGQPIEVGMKLRASENGFITGVRFYKQSNNTGTHVGHLWSSSGQQLAEATFTGESTSGWQEVQFSSPVAVTAGTTYVVSYFSPTGFFAFTSSYFGSAVSNPPLTALANGTDGPNGVYRYNTGFPTTTYSSSNYWVDAIFKRTSVDSTSPTVTSTSPNNGATSVALNTAVTATFNEPIAPSTLTTTTMRLTGPGGAVVDADVSYGAATRTATLLPNAPLAGNTTYTATVKGGSGGVTDTAGNALAADRTWSFTTVAAPPPPPNEGPGGPVLVIASPSDPFGKYYGEILRAEGLNEFTISQAPISDTLLAGYDVALLAPAALTAADVSTLTTWVQGGGNLIAMRPDKKLAPLLGLTDAAATLANAYLRVDNATPAGAGIVSGTIQYHGTADRYTVSGATAIATLYSSATATTANPAVSLRSVGTSGGQAAAFTYDLSRSIVQTRQGNPAWAGQKRDGMAGPIRSDDMVFPDWIDVNKQRIPQADEQQRLLANLITQMALDRKPLPRFWYLPDGEKAAVVLTGDDHGSNGTAGQLTRWENASPAGCSVAAWECVRSTSYMYNGTPISNASATAFQNEGFELALHLTTNCLDYTTASLNANLSDQLASFASQWPGLAAPATSRTHCIAWSDYVGTPKAELNRGIRLDTNFYQWGPQSLITMPGTFTGSHMPMRFADLDGSLIDVYQAHTQLPDEGPVGTQLPQYFSALADDALGPNAYYGVFTVNAHTDQSDHPGADQIVDEALTRSIPIVSAKQMLTWLDGRNGSSFGSVSYASGQLSFTVTAAAGSRGLQGMLPVNGPSGTLTALTRSGQAVPRTVRTIKGIDYAMFPAVNGTYTATYS